MSPDALFLDEALANLDAIERALRHGDFACPDPEAVHALFRHAHSVKGGAAAFGLDVLAELMHLTESLIDPWRAPGAVPDMEGVALVHRATQAARLLLSDQGPAADSVAQDMLTRLRDCVPLPAAATKLRSRLRRIAVRATDAQMVSAAVSALFADVAGLGELKTLSTDDAGQQILIVRTTCDDQELIDLLAMYVDRKSVTVGPTETPSALQPPIVPAAMVSLEPASVRVDAGQLRRLSQLARALMHDCQRHNQQVRAADAGTAAPQSPLADGSWQRDAERLAAGLDALCYAPASTLFDRIPPLLTQLAGQLHKRFELVVVGGDLAVERVAMPTLIDPLVHLVRNACDHGIELPARRAEVGKPPAGRIEVSAWHEPGWLRIAVRDDGAGLSRDNVLRAARDRAIPVSDCLDDQAIWQLVFAPGLTTVSAVSEVSGRGVGMDVVRRKIAAMGGTATVESTAGVGTCVTMSIPIVPDSVPESIG